MSSVDLPSLFSKTRTMIMSWKFPKLSNVGEKLSQLLKTNPSARAAVEEALKISREKNLLNNPKVKDRVQEMSPKRMTLVKNGIRLILKTIWAPFSLIFNIFKKANAFFEMVVYFSFVFMLVVTSITAVIFYTVINSDTPIKPNTTKERIVNIYRLHSSDFSTHINVTKTQAFGVAMSYVLSWPLENADEIFESLQSLLQKIDPRSS